MFSLKRSGFDIKFPNGIILSTVFGPATYSDNYDLDLRAEKIPPSSRVEIGVIDTNVDFDSKDRLITDRVLNCGDCVMGYVELSEWLQILEKVRAYDESLSNDARAS
jgi:hypothetical protein